MFQVYASAVPALDERDSDRMKLYDCLQLLRKAIDVKLCAWMSYHVVSFDFSKFASPGHFSLPLSPSSQLKAGLEFLGGPPATECLDCLATQNVYGLLVKCV